MIEVQRDHLGGTSGRATTLDGSGRTVADLEEAHQPRGGSAAGERLTLAPHLGEVGAGAGAVLKDAGLPHPEVHQTAVADQGVLDTLDKARMGLRPGVGVLAFLNLAVGGIDVEVTLGRTGDAVGPGEP